MKLYKTLFLTFFSLGLFLLSLPSCKESSDSNSISKVFPERSTDTITINVGFPFKSNFFDFDGRSYICLYDLATYKKAKLYDENLNLIKTFSLDHIDGLGLLLEDMEMITPDSVVLVTDYSSGTLIALNTKTLEYKTVKLNNLVSFPEIKLPLEFYPSQLSGFKFDNQVAFDVKVSQSAILALYPENKGVAQIKIYDSINSILPFYVTISDPFGKEPVVKNYAKSKALLNTFRYAYNNEVNNAFITNSKLVNTSRYLNYFDVYDKEKNKTFTRPIKSEFTDIAASIRKWEDLIADPSLLRQQIFNDDLKKAGRIKNMFYDEINKHYHVLLFYSQKRRPIENPEVSPFIWQVYDENFVLLDEREHAPTDLVIGSAIATKKCIYFPYYNAKTYDPSQAVLVRYNY